VMVPSKVLLSALVWVNLWAQTSDSPSERRLVLTLATLWALELVDEWALVLGTEWADA